MSRIARRPLLRSGPCPLVRSPRGRHTPHVPPVRIPPSMYSLREAPWLQRRWKLGQANVAWRRGWDSTGESTYGEAIQQLMSCVISEL